MDQQRNVIALEPQLFVCRQHVRNLSDARVVVAKHDEDGVVVPAAFLRNLHQAADVEIQKADRVVLRHAAGTGALHLFQRQIEGFEAVVLLGYGERTMVTRRLDIGKEGLALPLLSQQPVTFLEQVQIGDSPHIHHRRVPVALFI